MGTWAKAGCLLALLPLAASAAEAGAPAVDVTVAAPAPGESLRLEVDAIDVTALLQQEPVKKGLHLHFSPPQPLLPGEHAVRLYRLKAGAAPAVAGNWTITVPAPARDTSWRAALGSNANGIVQVRRDPGDESRGADGTLSPALEYRQGHFGAHARADVVGLNDGADRHAFDLGDYNLGAGTPDANLAAGYLPLAAAPHSFIADNTRRRGVGAHGGVDAWRLSGDAFVTRSGSLSGFRDGFGVGDADRRIVGGFVGFSPLAPTPEKPDGQELRVWLGDVQARAAPDGGFDADGAVRNTAQSIGAQWSFAGFSLWSEAARSRTAADGVRAVRGHAFGGGLGYAPPPRNWGTHHFWWSAGLDHHRVDSRFDSRANFSVPADEERSALNFGFGLDRFTLQAEFSHATDNVDDLPIGRVGNDQGRIALGFAAAADAPPWFGAPAWSASILRQNTEQLRDHPDPQVQPLDNRVGDYQLGVQFGHPRWSWSLSAHRRTSAGATALDPDLADAGLSAQTQPWPVFGSLTLAPRLSLLHVRNLDAHADTEELQSGLNLRAQPFNRVDVSFDAAQARDLSGAHDVDDAQLRFSPALAWTLPLSGTLNLVLSASGVWQRDASFGQTFYTRSALLNLGFAWPLEVSHAP